MKTNSKKVGIITYHSAYNFGSQLQAFAMQEAIKSLDFQPVIINYRMRSQKEFYKRYRTKYGVKTFLYDLLLMPENSKRKLREYRFEKFMRDHMHLTKEFEDPASFIKISKEFDVLVSGSDQIWNKHSNELKYVDWKYMSPYLLEGADQRKISYASSIANSTNDDIKKMLPLLKKFDAISTREQKGSKILSKYLNRKIDVVLDPTFLVNKTEWIRLLNLKEKDNNFILYYTLNSGFRGYQRAKEIKDSLIMLSQRRHAKIIVISPFLNIFHDNYYFEPHNEFGPTEFIQTLLNSQLVITDSFHGTALAINLNKDFYSICYQGDAENRKIDLLLKTGLKDRIMIRQSSILNEYSPIDYGTVNEVVDLMRKESQNYLADNIF